MPQNQKGRAGQKVRKRDFEVVHEYLLLQVMNILVLMAKGVGDQVSKQE
jgi:hypothetical protein